MVDGIYLPCLQSISFIKLNDRDFLSSEGGCWRCARRKKRSRSSRDDSK